MMSLDDFGHDFDVEIEVNGDRRALALEVIIEMFPGHVWYRWLDLDTGDNGRNQDVFPALEEDWDEEVRKGWKYEVDDGGLPLERQHGPAPLFTNDEKLNKKPVGRAPARV